MRLFDPVNCQSLSYSDMHPARIMKNSHLKIIWMFAWFRQILSGKSILRKIEWKTQCWLSELMKTNLSNHRALGIDSLFRLIRPGSLQKKTLKRWSGRRYLTTFTENPESTNGKLTMSETLYFAWNDIGDLETESGSVDGPRAATEL